MFPSSPEKELRALVNHSDQIQRIRTKLKAAQKADPTLKVFGAKHHKYQIGQPASESEVCAFEKHYFLTLPTCYRSFLTGVGNGGLSTRGSAAGPSYGIYPLGESVSDIIDFPAPYLNKPAILEPDTTEETWAALNKRTKSAVSEKDYQEELGKVYAGLLPIGSQGCSYIHALVLNGPHQGRVVNLDLDGRSSQFAFESNFLDWYERWLDEIIAGYLLQDRAGSFGYTMAGDDEHLMRVFADADDHKTRLDALKGLAKLITATERSCGKLLELCSEGDAEIRRLALRMLTKLAYPMARAPLQAHIVGNQDDCLAACQSIRWYAKKESMEWVELLRSRLPTVNSAETFQFLSYLLVESGVDFSEDFRPFCAHKNEEIRRTAFYRLGKLKNKKDLVELFIVGLDDAAPWVVHSALQALNGIRDQRLLQAYARVVDRFKTDECHILTNLEHNLKEMGFKSIEKFRK
jgi:SMI1 / KNR4 family (SUKH-1)